MATPTSAADTTEVSSGEAPLPEPAGKRGGRAGRSYRDAVAAFAQRLVDAQRPIRVLNSLRWGPAVEEHFRRSKFQELPAIGPEAYEESDLGYDPAAKVEEFDTLARDIEHDLGSSDTVGTILLRTAREYAGVVEMLAARGRPSFYEHSRRLYGSPKEELPGTKISSASVARQMAPRLARAAAQKLGPPDERLLSAGEAVAYLAPRLRDYFAGVAVQVQVDESIAADAAAGTDYVKIREGARFRRSDLDVLEAHEGWVHVATSLNGQAQPVAKWLAKGSPGTTAVQEGLAVLTEVVTFRSSPERARRLNNRVLAVDMAEDGASFLDVFEWLRTQGYDEEESFNNARRVFRGGLVGGGGPFTKDACYARGLLLNFAFVRAALRTNRPELVPFLFVGKVTHEDVPVLYERVAEGLIELPNFVPAVFRDLRGLAVLTAFNDLFAAPGGGGLETYYDELLDGRQAADDARRKAAV